MKRALLCLGVGVLLVLLAASPASAAFGLEDLDANFTANEGGSPAVAAGSHPYGFTTKFSVSTETLPEAGVVPQGGGLKDLVVDLPPGLAVDPSATPRCPSSEFLVFDKDTGSACPNDTAVGFLAVRKAGEPVASDFAAVYNLVPPAGVAAKLGFHVLGVTVTVNGGLREGGERNAFASLINTSQAEPLGGSELTLWGDPESPVHNSQRGNCAVFGGSCPATAGGLAFFTMPTSCSGPLTTVFHADAWENPGAFLEYPLQSHETSGCGELNFAPTIDAKPTSTSTSSPTGLNFHLDVKDEGLTDPEGRAQSTIKNVVVALPEGVTVNPSAAEGLGACTKAQYEAERLGAAASGQGCPPSSKIGTVRVETPLLDGEPLDGAVYQAQPDNPATAMPGAENPFDSLLALYMVIENAERGIFVKQAGKVEPNLRTGQLVSTFDGLPQLPFSSFDLRFREGNRAPLVTPPTCGTYATKAELTPWADPTKTIRATSTFTVSSGVGGAACSAGAGFAPGFEAGTLTNAAGAYSPFYMRVTRGDGAPDLTRLDAVLPPGVVGKLAGLTKCPDSAIAAVKLKSGREELALPSCPRGSEIGHTLAGAGVGPALTWVPGELYLAGPFGGDPLSIVSITPAVAGPFDVGTVMIREALRLNPDTAQVEVDGAASDPIPHIIQGIPLDLRDLRIFADRPEFTLNPTGCNPTSTSATLFGTPFVGGSGASVLRSARFQAAGCAALGFKPRLSLSLSGASKRGGNPSLQAVVRPLAGQANIGSAIVTLPHSAFLDQGHIRTVCTRVQFAANQCPAGSIYGRAKAWTPLLDEPLQGPVYLRSNGGERKLPDLVVALHGIVDINLVGYIDSVHARIRTRFAHVPDAPVSRFVLNMQGGKKGLIENSADLCARKHRADATFLGQNGKRHEFKPAVRADCKRHGKRSTHR